MFMTKLMFCISLIPKQACSELSSHSNITILMFTHKPVLSITVSYPYHLILHDLIPNVHIWYFSFEGGSTFQYTLQ